MNKNVLKLLSLMLSFLMFTAIFTVRMPASALEIIDETVTINDKVDDLVQAPIKLEEVYKHESEIDFMISDYPVEESGDVELSGLNSGTFAESFLNGNYNGIDSSSPSFENIYNVSNLMVLGNCSRGYLGIQGGCFDGEYYYFAFLNKYNGITEDAFISCFTKNSSGSFVHVATKSGLHSIIRHANDMTYNSDTGEVVISCGEENYENRIYTVLAEELRTSGNPNFILHNVSIKVSGIAYNSTRRQYAAKLGGYLNSFAILDSDFNFIKYVGYGNNTTDGWVSQGITADNQYVYLLYFNENKAKNYEDYCNRIRIFDWDGNYIKTIRLNIDNNGRERIYECENIMFIDDEIYIGFGGMISQPERNFLMLSLSNLTYHIQYCPDENVNTYKYQYNNGNINSVMLGGVSMPLRKFRVEKTGYEFIGWTAYRCEEDKWLYKVPNASGGTTATWLNSNDPATNGLEKYVYTDKQNVSQTTTNGNHVLMCAQWKATNKFYVKFIGNGGKTTNNKTEYDFEVVYGVSTSLPTNSFSKTNRTFQHWNAYWSEKNKWYYINPDTEEKGWYKEGYQPDGYMKYEYADGQNVAQTAYKGGHIYMYAVWNEFTVYYDAGGALIPRNKILESDKFIYNPNQTTLKNYFDVYDSNFIMYSTATQSFEEVKLSGYTLYRADKDESMYVSPGGTKIWLPGREPTCNVLGISYTLYEREITDDNYLGSTATPGETLILTAVWDWV